jgi:mutator protein MutT
VKPTVTATAAIVERGGKYLITQRRPGGHLPLAWEFPGGKLEPDEAPAACLAREVFEEVGTRVRVGEILDASLYPYERFNVLLLFYECVLLEGEPYPCDCRAVRWIPPEEFPRYAFPPADIAVIEKLRRRRRAS